MSSDISYIARIPKHLKGLAIGELKNFCINTDDFEFDSNQISTDCMISFLIEEEEATKWFKDEYGFSNSIPGKTVLGNIQLWIKDVEGFCDFEFWALSSSLGRACLDSKALKGHLLDFVKKMEGQSLEIDYSNGFIETIFEKP